MYKMVIESNSVTGTPSDYLNLAINNRLKEEISKIRVNVDGSINMEEIQRAIIPIVEKVGVFISYDHSDERAAKIIASRLFEKGHRVFLDCLFWKSVDEALLDYNWRYCRDLNGVYEYDKTMKAASSFHMILSDSIAETVKNSRVFVFIHHSGSFYDSRTVSPWIYLENKVAKSLPTERRAQVRESFGSSPKIMFDIDTFGYQKAKNVHDIVNLAEAVLK